jgi:hypothetical protein
MIKSLAEKVDVSPDSRIAVHFFTQNPIQFARALSFLQNSVPRLALKEPSPPFLSYTAWPSSLMTRLPVTPGEYFLILALGNAVPMTLAA